MTRRNLTAMWVNELHRATSDTFASHRLDRGADPVPLTLEQAIGAIFDMAHLHVESRGGRFILLGNGGSLAIASHIATDFNLIGWPAFALTDAVALTSHANDFGVETIFSKQLETFWRTCHGTANDIIIAMSCSGKSPNILRAVRCAFEHDARIITLSGFAADNPLRSMGDLNFYVPSSCYGHVQLAHESILHAALDIENGWGHKPGVVG